MLFVFCSMRHGGNVSSTHVGALSPCSTWASSPRATSTSTTSTEPLSRTFAAALDSRMIVSSVRTCQTHPQHECFYKPCNAVGDCLQRPLLVAGARMTSALQGRLAVLGCQVMKALQRPGGSVTHNKAQGRVARQCGSRHGHANIVRCQGHIRAGSRVQRVARGGGAP